MIEGEYRAPKDFGAFREILFGHFDSLSPHLRRIAEYALGEPNRFALQTVAEVAGETGVQPSTLVRFAKRFGFSGYSELQQLFRARLLHAERSYRERLREHEESVAGTRGQDAHGALRALANASVLAIEELNARVDAESLTETVRLLRPAHTVHVIGRGRGWPIALCLAHGLTALRRACSVPDGLAANLARQVATMDPGDVLIAIGLGEESPEVLDAIDTALARKVPVVAITDSELGALARRSSVYFAIRDPDIRPFPPLAAHVVLAQSLILALDQRGPTESPGSEARREDDGQ